MMTNMNNKTARHSQTHDVKIHRNGTASRKLSLCASAVIAGLLAGCGGGNDPEPQNVPFTPESTSADMQVSVVKGTVSGAHIQISALNGSNLTVSSSANTGADGSALVTVTSDPGFGIKTLVKVTATTDAASSMLCDAAACGDVEMGATASGDSVAGVALTTLGYLAVPYNSGSDGNADASAQANGLTTLATALIEDAIAGGRNVSTPELLALAQADYSAFVLRAMGWQSKAANVFTMPAISAVSTDDFVAGEECEDVAQTDGEGNPVLDGEGNPVTEEVCTDVMVDDNVLKISLFNASLAQFAADSTLQSHLQTMQKNLMLAAGGDEDALAALRQDVYNALTVNPLVTALGLTADDLVDLELPLFDEAGASGPQHEVTTTELMAGATITASGAISDNENEAKAFDKNPETKWLDDSGVPSVAAPSWIQVDFAAPQAVNAVYITSANDAPARDPENFSVLASNDAGTTWVNLADIIGASFDERFQQQKFAFANDLKYSSFRVSITKNAGNAELMQLAEIRMTGPVYASVDHTDQVSFVATARSSISDNENQDKAFDNNAETKWLDGEAAPTEAAPSWVQLDFTEAVAVNVLALTSANDAPARDPENFNLQASNDGGETWTSLASWVGETFDDRFQRREFQVSNQLAFTTCRFNITKNQGNADLMQIGEIELIGPTIPGLNHAMTAGATYTARDSISDAENQAKAFDGDVETKWLDGSAVPTEAEPTWVQVDLPSAQAVNTLTLTSANDAPARDPENFSLKASNDAGTTWVTLGSWVGESFAERFETLTLPVANTLAFSSYRLEISKNAGNAELMQVAEIGMLGPQYAAIDLSGLAGTAITARNHISEAEAEQSAFDDDPATKWLDHNDDLGGPTEADPSWIQADLPSAQIVSALAITSANDAPARDPENFALLGSNDGGATWTTIASFVGESWADRGERRLFTVDNAFAYSTYRLSITKNNAPLLQIAEIELIGYEQE